MWSRPHSHRREENCHWLCDVINGRPLWQLHLFSINFLVHFFHFCRYVRKFKLHFLFKPVEVILRKLKGRNYSVKTTYIISASYPSSDLFHECCRGNYNQYSRQKSKLLTNNLTLYNLEVKCHVLQFYLNQGLSINNAMQFWIISLLSLYRTLGLKILTSLGSPIRPYL